MFEYNNPDVEALADVARRQYREGAPVISLGSVRIPRTATVADGTNAVRAVLVAFAELGIDDATRAIEDALAVGFTIADAIADVYADALAVVEFVENVDGSVHVATVHHVTARRATDTTAVVIRHADGTTETRHQTAEDVDAVVTAGHRRLLTAIADGVLDNYEDDVDADTVGELSKFPTK